MAAEIPFPSGNCPQKKQRRVSVDVEVNESAISFDILQTEVFQKRTLPASRFADNRDMHRPPSGAEHYAATGDLIVYNAQAQIDAYELLPSTRAEAIANCDDEGFERIGHSGYTSG